MERLEKKEEVGAGGDERGGAGGDKIAELTTAVAALNAFITKSTDSEEEDEEEEDEEEDDEEGEKEE